MPTFTEARDIILRHVMPTGPERVHLLSSTGRVIAEDIISPCDLPPWDNSAMDGFAVRAADCQVQKVLPVSGFLPAGECAGESVPQGSAIRIMTGAPLPDGADAVVPFEETEDLEDRVRLLDQVNVRQHIRFRGEDVAAGELIIPAGTIIRPPHISMLASLGKAMVPVYRRLRVAIVSTGDELIELGGTTQPGKIINSNSLALAAAVAEAGGEPVMIGIARDNLASHREKLAEGLKADALITSAGVSAGDRDLVREVLSELGVRELFWKVQIKPGGPTAFGICGEKPVFALPGNPVSTLITFDQFVRPALLKMMGHQRVFRGTRRAVLENDVKKKGGKVNFLRVRLRFEGDCCFAASSGDQHTGIVKTMINANALAILPADRVTFKKGEEVDVQILDPSITMTSP